MDGTNVIITKNTIKNLFPTGTSVLVNKIVKHIAIMAAIIA